MLKPGDSADSEKKIMLAAQLFSNPEQVAKPVWRTASFQLVQKSNLARTVPSPQVLSKKQLVELLKTWKLPSLRKIT